MLLRRELIPQFLAEIGAVLGSRTSAKLSQKAQVYFTPSEK